MLRYAQHDILGLFSRSPTKILENSKEGTYERSLSSLHRTAHQEL